MASVLASPIIAGVTIVEPTVHRDERGSFAETYRSEWFPEAGEMVQANRAERVAGTVVGLHHHRRQCDYWTVVSGHARAVLHDLRPASDTAGATWHLDLGEVSGAPHNHLGVFIPPGVAHGFAAHTDVVLAYLVDRYYDPADELGVAWDDPAIAADWGLDEPTLSARDLANPSRRDAIAALARP